jgi:predicted DNA binding CopG/RHH family protein
MTAKRTTTKVTKPRRRVDTSNPPDDRAEADAADYYNRTHDLSGFDGGEVVELESPPAGTRNVTLSIRLSPEELQTLGQRAEAAGMKLTTYIRGAALQAEAPPVDNDLIDTAAEVVDLIAALRASVEAAKARREQATINPSTAVTAS